MPQYLEKLISVLRKTTEIRSSLPEIAEDSDGDSDLVDEESDKDFFEEYLEF
jgi:hypothetical protein